MTLQQLIQLALNKQHFTTTDDYAIFCRHYLAFIKFLFNRLTGSNLPYFAVFLNDVQRKGKEPQYGINSTFLTGHYKGYTVKLNPLDGVYYCDLRPNMRTDPLLRQTIRTLDCLLVEDIWNF